MYHSVEIEKIEVPKKWRTVRKAVVGQIAESLEHDGLLQPIGVRDHPTKDGHYELVWGRHRLEAAKKLGWKRIDAKHLAFDDDEATSATHAENLFRHELNPAERVVAFKSQKERYLRLNPGADQERGVREVNGEKTAPGYAVHAERTTGVPAKTVERYLAAGKNLTAEQLGVLAETAKVKLEDIKTINKLDEPKRQSAVNLIAAGVNPKEAISRATLPADAVMTETPIDQDGQAEDDLSDEAWVETYCGEVLTRLRFQAAFKRDAVLYRQSRDARHKFRGSMRNILSQGKVQIVGPFYRLLAKTVNVDHPSKWLPCGPCGGSGMDGNKGKCGNCRGDAYVVKTAGGGR